MSQKNNIRQMAVSITAYTAASILGPLIVFGGGGYYIGTYFGGGKVFLFVGIGIAFIATNTLQFFKIRALLRKMDRESGKNAGNQ